MERIRQGESHAKVRDAMALSIGVISDGGVKREATVSRECCIHSRKMEVHSMEFQDSYYVK